MKKSLLSLSLVVMVATMGAGCGEIQTLEAPQSFPPVNQPASSSTSTSVAPTSTPVQVSTTPVNGNEMTIYKNDKYGYQFAYDKSSIGNFNEKDFQLFDSSPARKHQSQQTIMFTLGDSTKVEINVYNNEVKGSFGPDALVTDVAAQNYKDVIINNKKAMQGNDVSVGGIQVTNTVLYGDKYIYEIKMSEKDKNQKDMSAYNAIVQSFEFSLISTTGTTASTSTKETGIYENSKYGYQISYNKGMKLNESDDSNFATANNKNIKDFLGPLQTTTILEESNFDSGLNISVYVFSRGKTEDVTKDLFNKDVLVKKGFSKTTINGKEAWVHIVKKDPNSKDYRQLGLDANTVFFGDQYIYSVNFSSTSTDQKYVDMQNAIIKTFQFSK